MSINSITNSGIPNIYQNSKVSFGKDKHEEKDPYMKYPTRLLAYTNEVGVAIAPAVSPIVSQGLWAPALGYFAADIADKYKKGTDGENPDGRTAVRRSILHAVASVLAPSYAIHYAQEGAMKLFGGKDFVKNTYSKLSDGSSKLAERIKGIPFVGKNLLEAFKKTDNISAETEPALKGLGKFIHNIPFLGQLIVQNAKEQTQELIDMGINTKGQRHIANAFKTAVGFATLAAVAIPIDIATEKLLIEKVVNPALGLKDHEMHNDKVAATGLNNSEKGLQMPEKLLTIQNKLK